MKLVSTLTLVLVLSPLAIQAGEKTVPATGLTIEGMLPDGDGKVTVIPPGFKPVELPAKLYEIKLDGGKSYTITLDNKDKENKEFDPLVVVQDKDGKQLAFDDDGGGELNSRLKFVPSNTGTFKIYAAVLTGKGKYVLKIAAQEVKTLDIGAKVEAELTKDVKALTYQVKLEAGKSYVIDMMAPKDGGLDPYLRLLDPSGKELAKDDDGGEFLDARITFEAAITATYQIEATSFLGAGAGKFTLTVKAK